MIRPTQEHIANALRQMLGNQLSTPTHIRLTAGAGAITMHPSQGINSPESFVSVVAATLRLFGSKELLEKFDELFTPLKGVLGPIPVIDIKEYKTSAQMFALNIMLDRMEQVENFRNEVKPFRKDREIILTLGAALKMCQSNGGHEQPNFDAVFEAFGTLDTWQIGEIANRFIFPHIQEFGWLGSSLLTTLIVHDATNGYGVLSGNHPDKMVTPAMDALFNDLTNLVGEFDMRMFVEAQEYISNLQLTDDEKEIAQKMGKGGYTTDDLMK
jgi:hypothetical protein